ncbi:MAG: hypothetical protein AB7V13_24855 [Pseudorhodoplanes sp.]|uniref:hypothetical protein n=1 Tax=Pseudorhodoplanes sp. TaxID=1934341 RepID=UPI003D10DF19
MRPKPVEGAAASTRRTWEPPAFSELPIGTETRSIPARRTPPDGGQANPPPPATPASKLGFSFEMSFPLSVRTE